MMKMTRKMAAMVAAMMAVSSIGAVNAFAESQNNSVSLKANVTEGTVHIENRDTEEVEQSDTNKMVWAITLDTDTLSWNIVKDTVNHTTTNYKLVWNKETKKYDKEYTGNPTTTNTTYEYRLNNDDVPERFVEITNNSNFAVSRSINVSKEAGIDASDSLFMTNIIDSSIAVGGNVSDTISINVGAISQNKDLALDEVTLGTATYTFMSEGAPVGYEGYEGNTIGYNPEQP
jgi:hypothetical protein